jgi:hypothetical protein
VLWAVTLASLAASSIAVVDGAVQDALLVDGKVWLATTRKGARVLAAGASTIEAPVDAVFVDACPTSGVIFADARGLVNADGVRVVEGRGLFTVPDPTALLVGDLCGKSGDGKGELRMPVVEGLLVKRATSTITLEFPHDARAYSGRVHRGLRPDRGYAEALSLYGPRLFDVDVDGDGRTDLVAVREQRLFAWRRAKDGTLEDKALVQRDIGKMVGAGDDADLRVRLVDVDGDKKVDAIVGVTRGAVPERSEAYVLTSSSKGEPFGAARTLWKTDGVKAAIGNRGRALVVAEIDTSLVSLSAVVLTGRIPVKVSLEGRQPIAMQAKVDVRGGRMDGALPVVSVDFDGDGVADLLDLGEPGRAALHKGTADGFALDATQTWDVPVFVHVVPMPELPGVVLVSNPSKGKTRVATLTR